MNKLIAAYLHARNGDFANFQENLHQELTNRAAEHITEKVDAVRLMKQFVYLNKEGIKAALNKSMGPASQFVFSQPDFLKHHTDQSKSTWLHHHISDADSKPHPDFEKGMRWDEKSRAEDKAAFEARQKKYKNWKNSAKKALRNVRNKFVSRKHVQEASQVFVSKPKVGVSYSGWDAVKAIGRAIHPNKTFVHPDDQKKIDRALRLQKMPYQGKRIKSYKQFKDILSKSTLNTPKNVSKTNTTMKFSWERHPKRKVVKEWIQTSKEKEAIDLNSKKDVHDYPKGTELKVDAKQSPKRRGDQR